MQSYILSIITSILLVSVCSIILPEGKMGKYIKSIFSLVIIIVMVNPLLNFFNTNNFTELSLNNSVEYYNDENYLDYVFNKRIENTTKNVENVLFQQKIDSSVEIIYEILDYDIVVKKVNVILQNDSISKEDEHIIITAIKQTVAKCLNISEEIVFVK